jgi:hypothetical protein
MNSSESGGMNSSGNNGMGGGAARTMHKDVSPASPNAGVKQEK